MPFIHDSSGERVVPCIINGKPVNLTSSANFPVVQGSTGKTIHYAQTADADTAAAACDAADKAFDVWRKTSVYERRRIITRFADILESKERFSDAVNRKITETSALEAHGHFDVGLAVAMAREAAAAMMEACEGRLPPPQDESFTSLVLKEPVGPILIIPPWNGAVILPVRGICCALAAGCSVVMKASEMCPWTHQIILEVFEEAGLPAGTLNQVQVSRDKAAEVTEVLISHPAIRKIEFIGSANVGRIVGQLASKYLKPTIMELGDQSPCIVMEDADLDKAADAVALASNILHGQICFATERIYVHNSIAQPFNQALQKAFVKFPSGGDAISATSFKNAKALVDEAVAEGAKFLIGDSDPAGPISMKSTILTNVNAKSRINDHELFGPAALLYTFETEKEAIDLANSKSGGLSASVYTKSFERGLRMSKDLRFGQVQVNQLTQFTMPNTPITGWKSSGWGSNGGKYGVEEFLHYKHVSLHNTET